MYSLFFNACVNFSQLMDVAHISVGIEWTTVVMCSLRSLNLLGFVAYTFSFTIPYSQKSHSQAVVHHFAESNQMLRYEREIVYNKILQHI